MPADAVLLQQLVRFVIEQYRDELVTSLQGSVDEHRVAEDREAVASDLLNILHRCAAPRALPMRFSVPDADSSPRAAYRFSRSPQTGPLW